jgi:PAS domain S-box-containing protein
MTDVVLERRGARLLVGEESWVRITRLLSLLAAVLFPFFGVLLKFLNPGATDPLWLRLAIAGLFLSVAAGTYISDLLRRWCVEISWGLLYVVTAWALALAVANGMSGERAQSAVLLYSISGLLILLGSQSLKPLLTYLAAGLLSLGAAFFFVASPETSPWSTGLCFLAVALVEGSAGWWVTLMRDRFLRQEKKLERQNDLLEQTQRLAGGWVANLQTGEVSWSEKVYEIHEMDPSTEICLEEGLGFYSSESRDRVEEATKALVEEGEPYDLELQIDTAKGNRRWVRTVGAPVETSGGEVTKVAGALQDITDRKGQERRRRQVISRVTDGILKVDSEWQITLVNDQAEAAYGVDEQDLLGRSIWEVFGDVEGTRFEEVYREAMRSREPAEIERYYPGLEEWFDVQMYPGEDGGLDFYFRVTTEQREREKALREAKSRYQTLIENFPDGGVFLYDEDLRYTLAGGKGLETVGLSLSTVEGSGPRDIFPEGPAEELADYFRRALKGEKHTFEQELGGRHYRNRTLPVRDGAGNVVAGMAVSQNITEEKKRERRLRQAETLFRNAQDALFLIDVESGGADRGEGRREFSIRLVNPAYEAATGFSREDLYGRPLQDIFGEEVGKGIEERYRRCLRRQEPIEYEEELPVGGEVTCWQTRIAPVMVEGKVQQIVGTTRDVTEQKKREKTLHERQEKLEGLYEATNHLLQAEGPEDLSARLSSLVRQELGYPATTIRLARGNKLAPAHVPGVVQERMPERPSYDVDGDTPAAEAYRSGETRAFEDLSAELEAMDRGDVRATAYVPMGSHGLISVGSFEAGGIGLFDLRLLEVLGSYAALVLGRLRREESLRAAKEEAEQSRKEAEEARQEAEQARQEAEEAKEEAQQASHLKSAFLANISHEIRTPLTSIIGFAEIIGSEAEELELPESSLPGHASTIERSGKRLLETLDGVLTLSKLQSGQMELETRPVDLAKQVRLTAEELRPSAEEKGLGLQLETGPAAAEADEGGVQIVIRNLLSNAIKYTSEGGTVRMRSLRDEGQVVVEVEDTGIGMDPEVAESLFEPFRQASEGFSREYEGTGVGLAVTSEAVEQMGGSIEVETEKGEGTRFTVSLPAAGDEVPPAGDEVPPAGDEVSRAESAPDSGPTPDGAPSWNS